MRTKIDKDVKKKDVVEAEPGDLEKKQSKPKKVKKAKKVENSEPGLVVQESIGAVPETTPADPPEHPPVCNEFPDEVEAAVNSITEPCERTSLEGIESVSDQCLIKNHVDSVETENSSKTDPEPVQGMVSELVSEQGPDPVPDSSELPVGGNAEEEIKPEHVPGPEDIATTDMTPSESEVQPKAVAVPEDVEVPVESEAGPKLPEPDKKPVPDYSSYDSIIDKVARGDIIVTTPPRKPPKKRRNDECKSKEKLNFSDNEKKVEKKKSDKKGEKKKAENSKKKDSPVLNTPEEKEDSSKKDQTVSFDAGVKNRSKRTPKKRKFHDEQDDEQKPKVSKKASPKPKAEPIEADPSETSAQASSSEKPKKSKKKNAKSKEQKEETGGEKKDCEEAAKPKKVKKEKSAKKSKKVTPKSQEETADVIVPEVSPQTAETAQCSSDSGIGGTDSEMKIGSVEASVEDGTSPSGENGIPVKMETETCDKKPAEQPKKKSKSSKAKKPKDTKEKVNGLPDADSVVVKEEEATKSKKKSKAKKRKSEDGEKSEGSKADEQKADGQGEAADTTPVSGEVTDKPSPKKKKKKVVENGEGEVKKVKKKKKIKAPPPSGEGKENGEVSNCGPNEAGVSTENGVGEVEGESGLLDTSKEGSEGEENENSGENKVGSKFKLEKKVLETRECLLCGHKTRGLAALTRHMKRIHQIITKPPKFKCDRCDFDAAKRAVYAKHMLLHNVIMCSKCPYVCSTSEALEEHIVEEHKNKGDLKLCRLCNRYVRCPENEDTLERHMEECKGKVPLICTECYKEFKYESGLKIHISTHFPDQPKLYTCELCSYQSNYKANLHKHIQNIHQEREKTIKCPECDKMFYKDEHMKRHLRLHTENRPYSCEKCEKTFKSLCAMRNHMESHNPGRPFKCEFEGCKKSFRTAKFLKNHVEEAHQLGEKRYHCSTQGCKFSFFKKSHLKRHEITHTGERNFHCMWPECGKSFRHADNLKVHQRQHTNEKPIKCTQCNFSCRQRNSLQWHIKKHHTNKDGAQTVSQQGSPSGAPENDSEPKVNGVATPGTSSDQSGSVKSESKGIDLYEFNDEDFTEELPVVFRSRDKPRFHVLTRQDLDELHEAEKSKPILDPLPDASKEGEEEGEKEEKEEKVKDGEEKKEEKKPVKTPKKKKKKVIATKKSPPVKPVKKVKSPKALKAPKSPKTPSSPRTPKSPKSQGTKKKGSPETSKKPDVSKKPETSKKKTVASKKKVSPQSKTAAASKKKSPAKKKETKSKAKSAGKKGKSKKAAKEDKKKEEVKEEEEKEEEKQVEEEAAPAAAAAAAEEEIAASPPKPEVSEEAPVQSPKPLVKPLSPGSDGSSPSPHSPHSERSEASPLLSENEGEEPAQNNTKDEEKTAEEDDKIQTEEPLQEPFQEPEVPELPKEEAMSPGQAQQEAIDRSLEENPIIDDNLKDNHSQPDLRQYSPVGGEEEKTEEQQIEDEEQRVSSDDEVTNDILLTPPRAPAPPPPQSPSEEEEEEELMEPPVPSPAPVSVPVQEPLSHPEPMSNQPLSQDPQQPLPSVEPPKDEAQPPQPPAPPSAQYQNTNPECEKDYLGQYLHLQELGVPPSGARDSVPEEPNRLQRLEELAEKPHEDSREIPRSASVASNVITHTNMQPFHNMSHKRMEILACDRSQEQHFQRDTASALPRLPDPPPFDSFNPLNSIHSVSRENNFLRQNDNIFTSQTTGSSFMRLSDSEAMRQRMTTPFLPQNDRTAISRLPDTTLRPTNPALLRRPTTMPSTDIFPPPPMTQTMPRNPFTNTWSGQDVRPPHWPQAPYLQRTIDRQPNATPATLFAKENYLASRDLMFDPSRMTERNMFTSLSSPQPQRELAPETFPLELSYFGSHAYSGTATLDYSRPPCGTAPKAFDERYRQTASSAMSDFRGFPQTSSTEMFSGIGVNSSFPLDKYMYTRDPVYHPQHVGENTNSAFLTHSTPTQHSVFDREYPHRSLYPHQNTPYPFLEERQYSTAAAKLTHSAGSTTNQEQEFMSRRNTTDSQIPPDPYRCGMLYNVMNRYSFE